jgi:hypothetical protein
MNGRAITGTDKESANVSASKLFLISNAIFVRAKVGFSFKTPKFFGKKCAF